MKKVRRFIAIEYNFVNSESIEGASIDFSILNRIRNQ